MLFFAIDFYSLDLSNSLSSINLSQSVLDHLKLCWTYDPGILCEENWLYYFWYLLATYVPHEELSLLVQGSFLYNCVRDPIEILFEIKAHF